MSVFLSPQAQFNLEKLNDYLLENWNSKARDEFVAKLTSKFEQISHFPQSCVLSEKHKGLYKCVLTKQTTFYYRITEKSEIEVITFFDTRQNPDNLKKDL
ncbi:MAG: type II toxin-antitoxin system RelE/ParE family toxin [Flavobacteriaceae bacterium]|nr:type II toxin-antitoxin system RelE/ParE family toxin [Flavobacteriaceae bacterium]